MFDTSTCRSFNVVMAAVQERCSRAELSREDFPSEQGIRVVPAHVGRRMRLTERARLGALTGLAAVAASASAGAAVLARDGLCVHRLLGLTPPAAAGSMSAMPGMPGMASDGLAALPAPALGAGGCPILLLVALAAAVLFLALLGAVRDAAAGALAAAFRLLAPGADAPWALDHAVALPAAGVRLSRRRPSRAPPLRT
jgi:hypothetical protein